MKRGENAREQKTDAEVAEASVCAKSPEGSEKQKARDALIRRALGYSVSEEVEEYAVVDGALALIKKKVNLKDVPPEISAIKLLLEQDGEDYSGYTEEELEKEKERLIKLLVKKEMKNGGK